MMSIFHPLTIILAAGESRRFNDIKQMAGVVFNAQITPMLSLMLKKLVEGQSPVIVATGKYHDKLITLNEHKLDFHYCDKAILGIGHTISQVTEYAMVHYPNISHVCFILADQVALTYPDIQTMLNKAEQNQQHIICSKTKNGLSVPSVFPKRYFPMLCKLTGDKGAKSILTSCTDDVISIALPNAEVDIDTQDELNHWNNTQLNN